MMKRLQGLISGVLIGATITGGAVFAANTTTLYDVLANGVKIVVDGQKLNPTDANGNKVEPIIYNGTTYLPVRAVANALGKAVYWDGPNYTVYLGDMDGKLEYPTASLDDVDNIGKIIDKAKLSQLTDNYGNSYTSAITDGSINVDTFKTLLNYKYSKFKGTIYVAKGTYRDDPCKIVIKADGKVIYTSEEITPESKPIKLDLNVKGCNVFEIEFKHSSFSYSSIAFVGDAGFYQ